VLTLCSFHRNTRGRSQDGKGWERCFLQEGQEVEVCTFIAQSGTLEKLEHEIVKLNERMETLSMEIGATSSLEMPKNDDGVLVLFSCPFPLFFPT
jgi:hypothetical protein